LKLLEREGGVKVVSGIVEAEMVRPFSGLLVVFCGGEDVRDAAVLSAD